MRPWISMASTGSFETGELISLRPGSRAGLRLAHRRCSLIGPCVNFSTRRPTSMNTLLQCRPMTRDRALATSASRCITFTAKSMLRFPSPLRRTAQAKRQAHRSRCFPVAGTCPIWNDRTNSTRLCVAYWNSYEWSGLLPMLRWPALPVSWRAQATAPNDVPAMTGVAADQPDTVVSVPRVRHW